MVEIKENRNKEYIGKLKNGVIVVDENGIGITYDDENETGFYLTNEQSLDKNKRIAKKINKNITKSELIKMGFEGF